MKSSLTPSQWTILALTASFLTAAPCAIVRFTHHPGSGSFIATHSVPSLLCLSILFFGSFALDLYAERRLQRGLATDLWSAEQVEAVRRWLTPRAALGSSLLVLAFYVIAAIFTKPGQVGALVLLLWPAMALSRLGGLLHPRKPAPDRILDAPAAPLTSSHWGQRA